MKRTRATAGNGSLRSKALKAAMGLAFCALTLCASRTAQAQSETWSNTGGNAWLTNTNWSNSTVPGTTGVAEFDGNPTGATAASGVGVNYGNAVNNGYFIGISGSLNDEAVGAIYVSAIRTGDLYIGNTQSSGSHPSGYMTLNSATVGGIGNTILSNSSSGTLVIQNQVQGSTGNTFGLVLGATSDVVQTGTALSSGSSNIIIYSTIDQASSGSALTVLGGGTGSITGGVLELAGTNRFTGGITIGQSGGTQAGIAQIDAAYALSSTGAVVVYNNSALVLAGAGTYGGANASLTLNGAGNSTDKGALTATVSGTWQGAVSLGSTSDIDTNGGSTVFTVSGAVTDNGSQLQKNGAGTLTLSNAGNAVTMTGSTQITNGTLQVSAGSAMGSGALQMNAGNGNNTAIILNNAAQSIGNLSSSPSSSGAETQTITLNSTALTINETGTTSFGLGSGNSGATPETSAITGNGSVILGVASTGILTFTGTQTYTGGTQINGGTLEINTAFSLATTGTVAVANGGALFFNAAGTYGALGQTLTLNGGGNANESGALTAAASGTWQGVVSLGSTSDVAASGGSTVFTLGGVVDDNAFQFQKNGKGTLILSNAGNTMTGSTEITNGTLQVNSGSSMGTGNLHMDAGAGNNTALTLNNAAQSIGNLSSSPSASGTETQTITLNSTALTINETGTTTYGLGSGNSGATPETSTIAGSGSVTLAAASTGALTFTGTQSYTGGTQVQGGTLYANGSLNGAGNSSTVNVTGAGALGGAGAIDGLVTGGNGGTITSGSAAGAIGELTLQNGLKLSGGGTFVWDLLDEKDNSTGTAGTDFDQLELTGGALTLGGSSALTLDILSGSSSDAFWTSNHAWTIISATNGATGSGDFAEITDPTYGTGTFSTSEVSGNETLIYTAGVPEPSALVTVALGAAVLVGLGRKRRYGSRIGTVNVTGS